MSLSAYRGPARRVYPSHPDYAELDRLQMMIVAALNPQLFFASAPEYFDLSACECAALVQDLETDMGVVMECGAWFEFQEAYCRAESSEGPRESNR